MVFRSFLKSLDTDDLDSLINKMDEELFARTDCPNCSNCCKAIVPTLNDDDIARISRFLGLSEEDFKTKYLDEADEEWLINIRPCPFLAEKGCTIYDYRPEVCRNYPFTGQKEISFKLLTLVSNSGVCPVVYEIFERLKGIYRKEFEKYKRGMGSY